ncbi:hypothetical protein GUITHDRAFT_99474 [Guillardia theta CCMP2712]|uniref:HTH CENPB-type domain-containing protein n=1 Tax=Guillardia theta (strain CCMP2712) TaxID=905079 RepID=L1K2L0_GUITC|nr:hypothetical protein GUITHDRAFT_99474 [Guillardia theta CCMP2712]EKX54824.1 hypothetical protein GUITHDRAFT_99474 [Guillardia theta CCMP2712]|eukprot:XP_005841804.1 hypothetical protein GUITHDRAFT_99474 [Guillardia theta CCMP2712]
MNKYDPLPVPCGLGNFQPSLQYATPVAQRPCVQDDAENVSETDSNESASNDNGNVSRRARVWTTAERLQHRKACMNKNKLTLGEKMEIIKRHTSTNPAIFMTQAQLATMFGKSRSAISKILKAENVSKLKQISDTGVHAGIKRYSPAQKHLELEKRIHQYIVEAGLGLGCRAQICKCAAEVATEMGMTDFKATHGWYSRFIKRHGLSKPSKEGRLNIESSSVASTPLETLAHTHVMPNSDVLPRSCNPAKSRELKFKVSLTQPGKQAVFRRLKWNFEFDHFGNPVQGYEMIMTGLRNAYREELLGVPTSALQLSYVDEDGDNILISSDSELGMLLQDKSQSAGIRLYLHALSLFDQPPIVPAIANPQPSHAVPPSFLNMYLQGFKLQQERLLVSNT